MCSVHGAGAHVREGSRVSPVPGTERYQIVDGKRAAAIAHEPQVPFSKPGAFTVGDDCIKMPIVVKVGDDGNMEPHLSMGGDGGPGAAQAGGVDK